MIFSLRGLQAVSFGAEHSSHVAEEEARDHNWTLARHFKLHLHPDSMKTKHNLKLDSEYNLIRDQKEVCLLAEIM
jgi:hypothetical protein